VILDDFIEAFRSRFSERELLVSASDLSAVIPAENADIGKIEVQRDEHDDKESIVSIGEITHGHFNCYEDELSGEEKQQRVVNNVMNFLESIFLDRIEFYGSRGSGGGWRLRGSTLISKDASKIFTWSGQQ